MQRREAANLQPAEASELYDVVLGCDGISSFAVLIEYEVKGRKPVDRFHVAGANYLVRLIGAHDLALQKKMRLNAFKLLRTKNYIRRSQVDDGLVDLEGELQLIERD